MGLRLLVVPFWDIFLIAVKSSRMYQFVRDSTYDNINIEWQRLQIVKDLGPNHKAGMLPEVMCGIPSVSIPQSQKFIGFSIPYILWAIIRLANGSKHHIFVVAQKHFGIGHCHDFPKDLDAVRMPVDHIAKDVESVLTLEVDLAKDGVKSPHVAVDVGQNVGHLSVPPLECVK